MNNEPVAWMLIRNESCVEVNEWYGVMRGWEEFLGDNEKIVELYTHPVKELTDEEVFNLEQQAYNLAMQVQNQKALIKQLEETQVYLYKTHDADKAEIEALKEQLRFSYDGQ